MPRPAKIARKTGPQTRAAEGEFDRIARLFAPLARNFPGALGLLDDAAILRHEPDRSFVTTVDAMVAGIHFFPRDDPADIAAKLLAVNLSDLAAMGASPYAYMLVISLPKKLPSDWLAIFAGELARQQKKFGISLIGGDSVSTDGPLTLSITAFGIVPLGSEVRRRLILPPDNAEADLWVSGTIGDAAIGLQLALSKLKKTGARDKAYFLQRLRRPEPRLGLTPLLRRYALAAVDISDGLVADAGHIAEVSGLSMEIDCASIPVSSAARRLLADAPGLIELMMSGGDDYEIAFAVEARHRAALLDAAQRGAVPLTRVGRFIRPGKAQPASIRVLDVEGRPLTLPKRGWQHF